MPDTDENYVDWLYQLANDLSCVKIYFSPNYRDDFTNNLILNIDISAPELGRK
jgi:hypothetical protein